MRMDEISRRDVIKGIGATAASAVLKPNLSIGSEPKTTSVIYTDDMIDNPMYMSFDSEETAQKWLDMSDNRGGAYPNAGWQKEDPPMDLELYDVTQKDLDYINQFGEEEEDDWGKYGGWDEYEEALNDLEQKFAITELDYYEEFPEENPHIPSSPAIKRGSFDNFNDYFQAIKARNFGKLIKQIFSKINTDPKLNIYDVKDKIWDQVKDQMSPEEFEDAIKQIEYKPEVPMEPVKDKDKTKAESMRSLLNSLNE